MEKGLIPLMDSLEFNKMQHNSSSVLLISSIVVSSSHFLLLVILLKAKIISCYKELIIDS